MIKINPKGPVALCSLCIGDTFLIDGRVCMLAKRNGHPFVLDLSTGKDYCSFSPNDASLSVIPIECELSYKIK